MNVMANSFYSVCGSWGAKNRIPAERLADTGRCGNCTARLKPVSEPVEVDENLFQAILSTSKVPVLVDFWAEWGYACRVRDLIRLLAAKSLEVYQAHPNVSDAVLVS
jgi:thiol:disulfide interchange protein